MVMPNQIRSAREGLRLGTKDVAEALNINENELKAWEAGDATPTIEQLWQLADFYSRDVDYFLTESPPIPVELNFRFTEPSKIEQLPLDIRKIVARFDELCRAQVELEEVLNETREVNVPIITERIDPEELAIQERARIGENDRPVTNIRETLERLGVRIFELDIPENFFSGLSWWHSAYGPCILVNYDDIKTRRNFTICHEYCHLLLGHGPSVCEIDFDYVESTDEEHTANHFAAAFLMPANDVIREFYKRELIPEKITDKHLGNLARRYGASLEAMGRRLENLGLVYRGFVEKYLEKWQSRPRYWGSKGGRKRRKWMRQLGERFVNEAFKAYSKGDISLTTLSHYFNIDIREAYKLAHEK